MRFEFAKSHPTFTAEDIRRAIFPLVGKPKHGGAWGALTSRFIRSGVIQPIVGLRAARISTSHGRPLQMYKLKGL
jgi:hypothetical protein